MCKFLCMVLVASAIFCFSACNTSNITDSKSHINTKNPNGITVDTKNVTTDHPLYSVSRNEDLTYSYQISDKKGNVLLSDDSSMNEPDIQQVSENVYSATIQTGTGLATNWAVFCDVESGSVSDTFHFVLGAQDEYVIFGDYRDGVHYILVQNIFDSDAYCKAYALQDTSAFADPVLGLEFEDSGCATVTYLTGNEDNVSETDITILFP